MLKVFKIALVAATLVALPACSQGSDASRVTRQDSKYTAGSVTEQGFEFSNPEEAQDAVGFDLLLPTDSVGGRFARAKVRAKSGGVDLPKEMRGVELTWARLTIAEAPFSSEEDARAFVNNIAAQPQASSYVKQVKVRGVDALAWERGTFAAENGGNTDGQVELPASTVIWSEGRVVYRIASETESWSRLMAVANSMK